MERRRFLQLGLGGAVLAAAPRPAVARPGAQAVDPFGHGVASGDPTPGGAIIWTRVTPSADATPGSGLGAPTTVGWEVSEDPGFDPGTVVASGEVTTSPDADHTVKVDVDGLVAATDHHYRFVALGATSAVGRFRTAPAAGDARPVRLGVVTCSNWEGGFFSAYRHLAARDDLDAVLHAGDYIYEYAVGDYGPGSTFGRLHDPDLEMTTLEHVRRRHALYKTDPDLQALHRRYAFVTTIDDHEVTDNSHATGARNHQPDEGDYAARRAEALQAYFEWMPIRVTGGAADPQRIWRRLGLGGLVDLFVLDERSHRSAHVDGAREDIFVTSPEVDDPTRTMLGAEQLAFLEDGLRSSATAWRVLLNPVIFAPFVLGDPPDVEPAGPILDAVYASLGIAPPIVFNGDQWDGYRFEQRRLSRVFDEVGGVVLVTGDVHSSWAAEVPADAGTYTIGGPTVAVEFVTPAVSSDSLGSSLAGTFGLPPEAPVAEVFQTAVTSAAPWVKYLDAERHGYGVLDVTAAAVQYDWYHVTDRADADATAALGAAWRTLAGTDRLERVAGPALQAPSAPSGPGAGAPTTATTATTVGASPTVGTTPTGGGAVLARTGGVGTPAAVAAAAAGVAVAAAAARRGGPVVNRRRFLGRASGMGMALALGPSFWARALGAPAQPGESPYGPLLVPNADGLQLPAGFTSRVVTRSLQPVPGTTFLWHAFPDGGACVPTDDGGWVYVSNSENPPPAADVPLPPVIGPVLNDVLLALGGVSCIRFDADGTIVDAYPSLTGSRSNCAGGLTPWGTWLTCEEWEAPAEGGTAYDGGKVWECDPLGVAPPIDRPSLGRMKHEAATVDPDGERLYLSEDLPDGLFYRYTPPPGTWGSGDALEGGTMEAMAVAADGAVTWVPVPDPTGAAGALREQAVGATTFDGGEGVIHDSGRIYLTTKNDDRVWVHDIAAQTMAVLYDAAEFGDAPVLNGVDNIIASAAHDLYVAEDGGNLEVCIVTPELAVAPILRMTGPEHGVENPTPLPTISEVTGLALSPDGNRLYFNSERGGEPSGGFGIMYEVTGPFRGGTLAAAAAAPQQASGPSGPSGPTSPSTTATTVVTAAPSRPPATGGLAATGRDDRTAWWAAAATAAGAALWRLRDRASRG